LRCCAIIVEIELLPTLNLQLLRLRVDFVNGDKLHIRESWEEDVISRYAYYWLDSAEQLRVGWDNAPHHSHLLTYPHHKHVEAQTNIEESHETTLESVLLIIRERVEERHE